MGSLPNRISSVLDTVQRMIPNVLENAEMQVRRAVNARGRFRLNRNAPRVRARNVRAERARAGHESLFPASASAARSYQSAPTMTAAGLR